MNAGMLTRVLKGSTIRWRLHEPDDRSDDQRAERQSQDERSVSARHRLAALPNDMALTCGPKARQVQRLVSRRDLRAGLRFS